MTITISPTTIAAVFGLFIGLAFAPVWYVIAGVAACALREFGTWCEIEAYWTVRRVAGFVAARNEFWRRWWRGE